MWFSADHNLFKNRNWPRVCVYWGPFKCQKTYWLFDGNVKFEFAWNNWPLRPIEYWIPLPKKTSNRNQKEHFDTVRFAIKMMNCFSPYVIIYYAFKQEILMFTHRFITFIESLQINVSFQRSSSVIQNVHKIAFVEKKNFSLKHRCKIPMKCFPTWFFSGQRFLSTFVLLVFHKTLTKSK